MNLDGFLEKFPPPGRVIFAKVWGSRSHNTHLPASDSDFAGVYVLPTGTLLSAKLPQEPGVELTWKQNGEEVKSELPDFDFQEVGKFANLLLVGNPSMTEMLFTERMFVAGPEWEELRAIRKSFLTRQSVEQYIGYMRGQLQRLVNTEGRGGLHTKGGAYNEKWCYHLLRLAGDAKRIARGEAPVVWKEGEEREFLMRVRRNEFSWQETQGLIERAVQDVLNAKTPAPESKKEYQQWLDEHLAALPIPAQGDKEALNRWLLKIRKDNWA